MMKGIIGKARVGPNQQPTRRMSDIGPRRSMDMRRRPVQPVNGQPPAAAQPQTMGQPRVRPAGMRPVTAQPMRQPEPTVRPPMERPYSPQSQPPAPAPEAPSPMAAPVPQRASGARRAWLVVLQFVIGLLVIVGVAAAIVALYLRYYQ